MTETDCPGHDVDPALADPLALTGAVTDNGSTRYYHITHCPDAQRPDHLIPTSPNDRGFDHYPPITGRDLTQVRVSESSLALEGPHLRMTVREPADLNAASFAEQTGRPYTGAWNEAQIHFHADAALMLADQIRHAVENHYQGPPD